jgi:tRNA(His) 5'-end guanylyltransferase
MKVVESLADYRRCDQRESFKICRLRTSNHEQALANGLTIQESQEQVIGVSGERHDIPFRESGLVHVWN